MNKKKCKNLILNMVNFYTIFEKEFLCLMPYINNPEVSPLLSRMLNEIHIQGKTTSSKLSEILNLSLPNTSRSINSLYKLGYINKNQDLKDKRIVYISLSNKGLDLVLQCISKSEKNFLEKLTVLSDKEIDELNNSYSNIINILIKARKLNNKNIK